jgi:hypothetical protein
VDHVLPLVVGARTLGKARAPEHGRARLDGRVVRVSKVILHLCARIELLHEGRRVDVVHDVDEVAGVLQPTLGGATASEEAAQQWFLGALISGGVGQL